MEINVVAEALDRVSNNSATAEITKWLRDGVPRIIQLERELKSQKVRDTFIHNSSPSRVMHTYLSYTEEVAGVVFLGIILLY